MQTTTGIRRTLPVFPNVVGDQVDLLLKDVVPSVIKIGMLATDDVVLRVASILERHDLPRVVDPLLRASDGNYLLERRGWQSLLERLIAGAALVTPNLPEAELLTGFDDAERAARAFLDGGAHAALVKGGHAVGDADDYLLTAEGGAWLRGKRIAGEPVHGTGCALSSAIAARLARGESLPGAVAEAKRWVASAIEGAYAPGKGSRILALSHT